MCVLAAPLPTLPWERGRLARIFFRKERAGRPRSRGRVGRGLLAEPRQEVILKLHARLHRDLTIELAEGLHAPPALLARLCARFGHAETRHRQHETRIDAVVAGLDAIPREHAGRRPTPRRLRAVAVAQDVD